MANVKSIYFLSSPTLKVLLITHNFSPGCVTLAHLACALRANEIMQVLSKRSQSNNSIWSLKDDEGKLTKNPPSSVQLYLHVQYVLTLMTFLFGNFPCLLHNHLSRSHAILMMQLIKTIVCFQCVLLLRPITHYSWNQCTKFLLCNSVVLAVGIVWMLQLGYPWLTLLNALEHLPIDVCFDISLRRYLPSRPFFSKKKVPQGLPLKDTDKYRIFGLAQNPDNFYHVIVQLQVYR